ncbi:hypothetical protein D9599_25870 [Roseomonas sp. KE2513]|uniref:hypothetical protein n=1 Tax=Roseomonas sp. KE2513 TaxID=2479202 RepID=UPI0018DF1883|nr:hypothetical protein [Roseomonas sp. KE2513]MBI0538984.1 hypothetical protein [Roseomonas sp. KE2513]
MAFAIHSTLHAEDRRRGAGFIPAVMTPELRTEIRNRAEVLMDEARAALDGATYLINLLDAADRLVIDLEPDADGETEAGEDSAQPITLSPDRVPVLTYRPSARQMRAAYRRNGDPTPATLRRGMFGRVGA